MLDMPLHSAPDAGRFFTRSTLSRVLIVSHQVLHSAMLTAGLTRRVHDVRWSLAASLLVKLPGSHDGLLWALLKQGGPGVAWVMHTLPRLGWLLAAAEGCYCTGGQGGQLQRSALAAILTVCLELLWSLLQMQPCFCYCVSCPLDRWLHRSFSCCRFASPEVCRQH
jgi:hypothetical protein